jgi:hypothetical protein
MDPEDLVLVSVMNNWRDFELARDRGWYRVPVKHAPEATTYVQYLAFYQTRVFEDEAYSINYYAPLLGHELARRRDLLPDEPDHPRADEFYYQLQIGPLLRREPPIPSLRWRRITFILTTGDRFMAATEINDLYADGKGDLLFVTLKEIGLAPERQLLLHEGGVDYLVDLAVPCRDGVLSVVIGEGPGPSQALRLSETEAKAPPAEFLATVQGEVERLGGVGVRPKF